MKKGFTLSEVLITLGIIGVIAAITIPMLVTNYQKVIVENRIKKFYSVINGVVRMSVAENGEPQNWNYEQKMYTYDENVEFLKTYFFPYFNYLKYENCAESDYNYVCVYMSDGLLFAFNTDVNGSDIRLFVNGKLEKNTRNYFVFQFNKKRTSDVDVIASKYYVEPYIMDWDGNPETLIKGNERSCNKESKMHYCTKLIEQNGWKIPKDYPW